MYIKIALICLAGVLGCTGDRKQQSMDQKEYVSVLRGVLHNNSEWIKVHAAEYLLWSGHPEAVKEVFLRENDNSGTQSPYRIGIWRVLAQAEINPDQRRVWIEKIKAAFLDTAGLDRIHAAETLAKLRISPMIGHEAATNVILRGEKSALSLYTRWSVCYTNQDSLRHASSGLITDIAGAGTDVISKQILAYALRQMGELSPELWTQLSVLALLEPEGSAARVYLLSAAYVTRPDGHAADTYNALRLALLQYSVSASKGERAELAAALAEKGTPAERDIVENLFNGTQPIGKADDDADVQAAAAFALLKMDERL